MHPRDLPPCDLVMKGGAASGVVYPGAVLELSRQYRFERVGGTSAGAVAAALAAAAEFARQRAGRLEMRGIEEVIEELGRPGFVSTLFQPAPAGRPLLGVGLALMGAGRSRANRSRILAVAAIRHRPVHAALATFLAAGVIALLAVAFQDLAFGVAVALLVLGAIALMLLGGWAILAPLGSMVRTAWRALPEQGFGICPGTTQTPGGPDAVTEWMYAGLQRAAELPPDQPLTFAMLERAGVGLQMVATDLGRARPVRLPFEEEQYLFVPAELRALFPAPVIDHVLDAAGVPDPERAGSRAWFLPAGDLPVVIGARLSASVPVLLSALKLYSARADLPRPVESFMSDGGITSNFPIHFFDDWLPSHPTFGLDLVPFPEGGHAADAAPVSMPSADAPRAPHWTNATNLGAFLRQVEDASRNWRDELQAELPGFRDRVCQIRMARGEGGFNLQADPRTVKALMDRGRAAGREILATFDWDQHRFIRYLTLMEMLQDNFALLSDRFGEYRQWLKGDASAAIAAREGRDPTWRAAAEQATTLLIEHAPAPPHFDSGEKPQPEPAMRIGPRV